MEKPFSLLRFVIFSSVRHLNLFRLLLPIHEIGSHLNAVDLKHLVLPLSVMKTKKIPFNFLIFFRDFSPYETEIIRKMESNKTWWTTYFSQKNKTKFTDHFFFWGLCNWWPLMQGISMITAVSAVYRFDLAITSHNWFLFSFFLWLLQSHSTISDTLSFPLGVANEKNGISPSRNVCRGIKKRSHIKKKTCCCVACCVG